MTPDNANYISTSTLLPPTLVHYVYMLLEAHYVYVLLEVHYMYMLLGVLMFIIMKKFSTTELIIR